ncbi:MAG: hypothetical protein JWO46_1274, partial [Nocardioidaceae bacterium]|nr:hypothetical protein [Nocardioidaceae bacterium]
HRAFENNIHIVDINGVDYTKALYDAARKGK